ncbi:sigma factor G inhibitor Gin [Jeotgalibacillus proteolyticus]|uniref:Carnitine--CoA ligase n=1 Tax=Jeotgalibacillus proteolyticus TaxID=2082395 RepID=A0A2S5G6A0_9BACL|nr:sigma factor G inhibitor Gin [Jeotgalibacillus proteolyticus]PPA68507.1 hypothetical protein C4B60_20310 [Jeotgalibacillus proteolyticus]
MKVCKACSRRYKRGIQVQNKLICSWCEQSLITLKMDDHSYDRWIHILRRDHADS